MILPADGWLGSEDGVAVSLARHGEVSTYMGHANISITLDRYGHLMPGNEDEAASLLDGYLVRATEVAARANLAPVMS